MEISFGASTQLVAPPTNLTNASINVAGAGSTNNQVPAAQPTIAAEGIQPSPVIRVNEQAEIESPFIEITENTANNLNTTEQQSPQLQPQDNTPRQIRELSGQQRVIESQRELLEDEQLEIQQEINELQRKELEINRRRFELQRQSSLGQIINLQI